MFWLIDSCQNSVSADQYRLTVSRAQVSIDPLSSSVFFEGIRWQVDNFQMIAGSSSIFLKCIWNKACLWAALLKFWFRTDLRRENLTGFYMQGRQWLWLFSLSRVDHALLQFLCSDRSKFDRWVHGGKFMQRLQTCLLIAEADRVLGHLVMFKTVFFYLMYKMKYSCY